MTSKPEMRLRYFEQSPRFDFIAAKDRYLFAQASPGFRFNVIGAGTIGQEHMHVTELEGRAAIHGVYDTQTESVQVALREFAKYSDRQLIVYDSLEEVCLDPAIDGLIICTPNFSHLDILRVAIKSGKPILLEKPMATRLEDAAEMVRISNDYPSFIQIGLQYPYKSIYKESLYEVLERHSIGEIKTISMLEHRPPFLDKVNQWNKFSEYSGGTLVEKCCHYFDLLNLFAGARPVRVFASGSQAVNFIGFEQGGKKSDIVDNACVIIDYENGVHASFSLNMFSPLFYEELIVCGDTGRLKAFEEHKFLQSKELVSSIEIQTGEAGLSRTIAPGYADFIEKSGHSGATYFEHMAFVDNIIEGANTNAADISRGLWSIIVGAAAEQSLKSGSPVQIKDLVAAHGIGQDVKNNSAQVT